MPGEPPYLLVLQDALLLLLHPPQLRLVRLVAAGDHVVFGAVRAAHLAARPRGLVDEGAFRTGPARLRGQERDAEAGAKMLRREGRKGGWDTEGASQAGKKGGPRGTEQGGDGGGAAWAMYLHGRGQTGGSGRGLGAEKVADLQRVQVLADLTHVHLPARLGPTAWRATPGKRDVTASLGTRSGRKRAVPRRTVPGGNLVSPGKGPLVPGRPRAGNMDPGDQPCPSPSVPSAEPGPGPTEPEGTRCRTRGVPRAHAGPLLATPLSVKGKPTGRPRRLFPSPLGSAEGADTR